MTALAELALAEPITETLVDDYDYEIVDGRKEIKMAGGMHGRTIMRLGARLQINVEQNKLGDMYSPDTTFLIGKQERLPDLAFLSRERIPADGVPYGKWNIAPDLAIEVISPNDVWDKVNEKVRDYFRAGVLQVWLVSLQLEEVWVYDSPSQNHVFAAENELASPTLLPGFKCRVGDLFQ